MATKAFESRKLLREHDRKKKQLLDELKALELKQEENFSIKKNTSNLFRQRKKNSKKIDVRNFNKVLNVDAPNLVAEVEGMTTYEDFVKATLKYSRLPTVVPELKSITVGGALSGGAIESSSFRHGLVHENILEFEVLLPDGQIILCQPDNEHKDLFYGFPNSYGTLGYALKIKTKLTPAKPFVELSHRRFTNTQLFFNALEKMCNDQSNDFVEGVIFNDKDLYLSSGRFTETAPYTNNYQYRKIYYKSISKNKTDFLTASNYIWRWDTDWFWCSKFFYMQNPILRLLFGKFLLKSTRYWKIRNFLNRNKLTARLLEKLQGEVEPVIQDVQIPLQHAPEFLKFFQEKIGITPLWICPSKPQKAKAKFSFYPLDENQIYINFGFWDVVKSNKEDGYYNRLIEDKVKELKGYKGLYSNSYYSKEEFWNIYDKAAYDALKKKYDPKNRLKNLYDKSVEK